MDKIRWASIFNDNTRHGYADNEIVAEFDEELLRVMMRANQWAKTVDAVFAGDNPSVPVKFGARIAKEVPFFFIPSECTELEDVAYQEIFEKPYSGAWPEDAGKTNLAFAIEIFGGEAGSFTIHYSSAWAQFTLQPIIEAMDKAKSAKLLTNMAEAFLGVGEAALEHAKQLAE